MPIQAPKMGGFGGLWTPKCDYSSSRPQKGASLRKAINCKNPLRGLSCRRVNRKCDGHTHRHTYMSMHNIEQTTIFSIEQPRIDQ